MLQDTPDMVRNACRTRTRVTSVPALIGAEIFIIGPLKMCEIIATLIEKGAWKDGKFPDKTPKNKTLKVSYDTKMLIFVTADTGEKIRINLTRSRADHQVWNKLKVGQKITGFKMLRKGIINPNSTFRPYSKGALF